jgi:hypothetical protein
MTGRIRALTMPSPVSCRSLQDSVSQTALLRARTQHRRKKAAAGRAAWAERDVPPRSWGGGEGPGRPHRDAIGRARRHPAVVAGLRPAPSSSPRTRQWWRGGWCGYGEDAGIRRHPSAVGSWGPGGGSELSPGIPSACRVRGVPCGAA